MHPITHKKMLPSLLAVGALLFSMSTSAFNLIGSGDTDQANPCETNCGFERGPDPTTASLEAPSGPFPVSTISVPSSVSGFGGGTIHYPTGTTGQLGAIAIAPGFVSPESSIIWWGPRLASHGFVVITIATSTPLDQPSARARQLEAALDHVISQSESSGSPISGIIDSTRVAAMGWSMGGGGTLQVASGSRLSAAVPLAPWNLDNGRFSTITTPTLIFGCQNDTVAPVGTHAAPFYDMIPDTTHKAYVEIAGGAHACANGGNSVDPLVGKLGVAWMKRHVDKDARYSQFLCNDANATNSSFSAVRDTCPF